MIIGLISQWGCSENPDSVAYEDRHTGMLAGGDSPHMMIFIAAHTFEADIYQWPELMLNLSLTGC